jgi:hypothetical protein
MLTGYLAFLGKRPKDAPRIATVDRTDYLVIITMYVLFAGAGIAHSWGRYSTTVIVMQGLFLLTSLGALTPVFDPDRFDRLRFLGRPRSSFLKFGLVAALYPFSTAMAPAFNGEPAMHDLNVAYLAVALFAALLALFAPIVADLTGYGDRAP